MDIIFVVLLEWLLRMFRFAYRFPSLYVLAVLLFIVAVIGFGVDRGTTVNDRMLRQADMHHLQMPPPSD